MRSVKPCAAVKRGLGCEGPCAAAAGLQQLLALALQRDAAVAMATMRKSGGLLASGGRGGTEDGPRASGRRRGVPRVALAAAALMMLAGAGVGRRFLAACC